MGQILPQIPQHGDSWRARAFIDLDALRHNIKQIRRTANSSKILAVVKADGYGHGLQAITRAIYQDVDGFAVATLAEGIACRDSQKLKPVVVLSEFWQEAQLQDFQEYELQPVIHSFQQIDWLKSYSGKPLIVWIKFDTGMNRLGIDADRLSQAYTIIRALPNIKEVKIISHLANADMDNDQYTDTQLGKFLSVSANLECEKSLANSAGVMRYPDSHMTWVRPGLMLYGASPFYPLYDISNDLKPVMHLQSRLIAVKSVDKDQPVGYGGVYRTRRPSRIAMIGFGYGDGYPRMLSENACVLIHGNRAPIIGRISMDMITVDVTDCDCVSVGDEATLWGHDLRVEEVASWANTIPYELLCKVTTRIPRILINHADSD